MMTPSTKPFMCGTCRRHFASDKAARNHIRDAHPATGARIFQAIEVVPALEPKPEIDTPHSPDQQKEAA